MDYISSRKEALPNVIDVYSEESETESTMTWELQFGGL